MRRAALYLAPLWLGLLGACADPIKPPNGNGRVAPQFSEAPGWFVNLQVRLTNVIPTGVTEEGFFADVPFAGSAALRMGQAVMQGTATGVDHVLFYPSGNGRLNVYVTIVDRDGDHVSANITGVAAYVSPGRYLLEGGAGTIINVVDPQTGVLHPTTGKYAHMLGSTFVDLGFISGFSVSPPGGSVHATWILH